MGKSGGSVFNTTLAYFPLKILPGGRPLEGMRHLARAPPTLLPGPPSHPEPRVASCGGLALSTCGSGDQGHGWANCYLTSQVFFLLLELNQPQCRRKLQLGLWSRVSPCSAAVAIRRDGSSSLISLHLDFPISGIFWNILMNPHMGFSHGKGSPWVSFRCQRG